ncbi:hypothetical protein SDC9_154631 [bioreactor metagenome]|uniref:ABC transporter Uup C-terminal domain-containing protein n=1 Tax=bioreactor metagenome TaxID=1076179 RepID=A0A645EZ79_9ZZZZ
MEDKKAELEKLMQEIDLKDYKKIEEISIEIEEITSKIEQDTMRWIELTDF